MDDHAKRESIFLTLPEAVQAVCIDFRQYPPQILLFAGILPLITRNATYLKREPGKNGAWINQSGQRHMQWLEGSELIEYMCRAVSNVRWNPDLASKICSRVFQTRVTPVPPDDTRDAGVLIETGMERFACRQCGKCCRTLNYRNELTQVDVSLWRERQRRDILKWVEVISRQGGGETYRMWACPKTGRPLERCPFLEKQHTAQTWRCGIQDVKPGICRQYPTSRKHALMTGCPGFGTEKR